MKKAQFKIYDTVIKDRSKEFDSWFAKGSKFYEYVTSMSQPEIWFIENTMAQIEHEPDQEEILRKSLIHFIFLDFEDRPPVCNKWDSTGEVARYWTRPEKHMNLFGKIKWNVQKMSTPLLYYVFVTTLAGMLFSGLLLANHGIEILVESRWLLMIGSIAVQIFIVYFIIIMGKEIYRRELHGIFKL